MAAWLTEPDVPDRIMRLEEDFSYTDPDGRVWRAGRGRSVNGASIPAVFWGPIFGSPYTGDFRRASVVHDIACDDRPDTSDVVHRMLYFAMRCDGTSPWLAGVMYAAVRLFGPQWRNRRQPLRIDNESLAAFATLAQRLPSEATLREVDERIDGLVRSLARKRRRGRAPALSRAAAGARKAGARFG